MPTNDVCLEMVQALSGEKQQVPLADLTLALTDFLEHFCVAALVGRPFVDLLKGIEGVDRLARFLSACGYPRLDLFSRWRLQPAPPLLPPPEPLASPEVVAKTASMLWSKRVSEKVYSDKAPLDTPSISTLLTLKPGAGVMAKVKSSP